MMGAYPIVMEMGRRKELPQALTTKIYYMALSAALQSGRGKIDLVMVANAIVYASENYHLLKPQYRF